MHVSDSLYVSMKSAEIRSKSIWGMLRGLETFSQLIYENDDGNVRIVDFILFYQ